MSSIHFPEYNPKQAAAESEQSLLKAKAELKLLLEFTRTLIEQKPFIPKPKGESQTMFEHKGTGLSQTQTVELLTLLLESDLFPKKYLEQFIAKTSESHIGTISSRISIQQFKTKENSTVINFLAEIGGSVRWTFRFAIIVGGDKNNIGTVHISTGNNRGNQTTLKLNNLDDNPFVKKLKEFLTKLSNT